MGRFAMKLLKLNFLGPPTCTAPFQDPGKGHSYALEMPLNLRGNV